LTTYATTNFRNKILQFGNKKYSKYYSCIQNKLYDKLSGFQKNGASGDQLISESEVYGFKARMASCTTNGSSYGFRLIVVENRLTKTFYLLDIYPKYGPLSDNGKINVDSKKAMALLQEAIYEKENSLLLELRMEKTNKVSLEFCEVEPEVRAEYIPQDEEE
jgi:hypothetical protein